MAWEFWDPERQKSFLHQIRKLSLFVRGHHIRSGNVIKFDHIISISSKTVETFTSASITKMCHKYSRLEFHKSIKNAESPIAVGITSGIENNGALALCVIPQVN